MQPIMTGVVQRRVSVSFYCRISLSLKR